MKSTYGRPQQKREKNEQSEQSKSGTKKCASIEFIPLKEATVSVVTICGGSLFHTSITANSNCEELCTNIYP